MFKLRSHVFSAAAVAAVLSTSACGSGSVARAPAFTETESPMEDMLAYLDQAKWLMSNVDIAGELGKAMASMGTDQTTLPAGALGDTLDGRRFDTTEAMFPPPTTMKSGESLGTIYVRYIDGETTFQRKVMLRDGQPFQCHIERELTASEFFSDERPDRTIATFFRDFNENRWVVLKTEGNVPSVATQQRLFDECLDVASRAKRHGK